LLVFFIAYAVLEIFIQNEQLLSTMSWK